MSRSLTRVFVVVLTASLLATRAYAVDSGAGALLDSFGLLALDELRTRGFTDTTSNVGVNQGNLHSQGALNVPNGIVAASSVRLGDGSVCKKLVANTVTRSASGCGPAPSMALDSAILGVLDPADVCGFPKPFPHCGGPAVTVPHGATQTLPPGTYSDVLVEGGGAGAGTLILNGGHYVFCGLRVSRYSKLLVKTATEIDVGGELAFSNLSTVGPAPGSTLTPSDLKIFVNGARLRFARKATVHTKLCAPTGALFMNDGATLDGCAVAKRIRTDHVKVMGTCVPPTPSTTTTIPGTTSTTITTTSSTVEGSTTTTSTSTTSPPCGNGIIDPGEQCDGSVPGGIFCLDSAGGAILVEAQCPLCTTGENGCQLDCSCCPNPQHCGTTSSTSSTIVGTTSTTSSTVVVASTSTTSSTVVIATTSTTSSTIVVATTSTTSSTVVPTTSTTASTAPLPTTSTTSTSTSSSTSSSSTVSTTSTTSSTAPGGPTTTTTLAPLQQLDFTIGLGTTNCGGGAFSTPAAAPLSGQLLDATATKIADLGLGCLYFGGGKNSSIPGGIIPTGSTTFFKITNQVGNAVTLGGAAGPNTSCTKGTGPAKHCVKGEVGTDGHGACTSDADCQAHAGSCVLDANCFFGPPLSIPNPSLAGTSTCVLNVIQNDVTGTGDLQVGSANILMTLASRVYLTGTNYDDSTTPVIEACPRCINNLCNKGANQGKACATTAPNFLSVDCPPRPTEFLATLPIALNPFTTGSASISGNAAGVFCPGQTTPPSSSLNAGALGKTTARTVKESGFPAGDITDRLPHDSALGSTFCIPATGNQLIDPVAGLPGPGALTVTGKLVAQ